MFDKLGVKILGLVENMSYFIGDGNKRYNIFFGRLIASKVTVVNKNNIR